MSKGSRGPADLMAKKDLILLYIQIKASSKIPRIKGSNITKLKSKSHLEGAVPVIATLQPFLHLSNPNNKAITIANTTTPTTTNNNVNSSIKQSLIEKEDKKIEFKIYFYNLHDWTKIDL